MRTVLMLLTLGVGWAYAQKPGTLAATATPKLAPKAEDFSSSNYVTITDVTRRAVIYYTTDGSVPTEFSAKYIRPFLVASNSVVKAIAIAPRHSPSEIVEGTYRVKPMRLGIPIGIG